MPKQAERVGVYFKIRRDSNDALDRTVGRLREAGLKWTRQDVADYLLRNSETHTSRLLRLQRETAK